MKRKTKWILAVLAVLIIGAVAYFTADIEVYATWWALLPPVLAIALALITKEVYSSLFIGVVSGGLLYSHFSLEGTLVHVFENGVIAVLAKTANVGILIFLVFLGVLAVMMNQAGGSKAFGEWAGKHIKSRTGAMLCTIFLGMLIFVDDYFNCLTVGNVMRPVTDKHRISRAKLAYLIDSTAAPVCIIAPISSWAAAVSGFVEGENGLALFIKSIPYNYYALFSILMMILLVLFKADFGPMRKHETNALKGDIFSGDREYIKEEAQHSEVQGKVIDLLFPIAVLIVSCIIGMIYTGGFFKGVSFIDAFAGSDASLGLVLGSFVALAITIIFYVVRRSLSFKKCMECIPEGFHAMVPAILILTLAWSLKAMTDSLGAGAFVEHMIKGSAESLAVILPAVIFVVAAALAFATGTSWGTFSILIPIVVAVFQQTDYQMMIISISACMAGAVCGDHCSPISDTTIMASAGAQCNLVNHVSTQLPYALLVAAVSCITYVIAGFVQSMMVPLIAGAVLLVVAVYILKKN
ncbi:MAG: Na+/H+ antiporter NhaC family protein [Lachnospiraceae bacterium]|nr:Na+/H+ antiporter NhaC family protein [Lachnospiraceae bacterium]